MLLICLRNYPNGSGIPRSPGQVFNEREYSSADWIKLLFIVFLSHYKKKQLKITHQHLLTDNSFLEHKQTHIYLTEKHIINGKKNKVAFSRIEIATLTYSSYNWVQYSQLYTVKRNAKGEQGTARLGTKFWNKQFNYVSRERCCIPLS